VKSSYTARFLCAGYEAALALKAAAGKNVKVMEGGIMAWPYPREK
jgi:rhodanese-related sulfurtransferase